MQRLLLASLVLVASACSKSDEGGNFAKTYCPEVAKCCSQLGLSGSDGNLCYFMFAAVPSDAKSEACLADVRAQVAAGTFCASEGSSDACNAVFTTGPTGDKSPGETCADVTECAPSSEGTVECPGIYVDSKWVHKCQVRMPGKAGDACLGTQNGGTFSSSTTGDVTEIPARGYVCNTADGIECSSGQCVALATVGQSCVLDRECVRSAFCDKSHCATRVAPGGACETSSACTDGYYCPQASPRQCSVQAGTGATCSSYDQCKSNTCVDGVCKPNMLDTVGWAMVCG